MWFIADRMELRGKLNQVGHGVAERYATLPVLYHVLLKAQDGRLELRTANLETSVEVSMPVSIETDGACTVPHERLFKWLGAPLPRDTVTVTLNLPKRDVPLSLRVQCGRNHSTYKGLYLEEEMPVPRDALTTAVVSAVDLIEAIQAVEWAALSGAEGLVHPVRTGILLEVHLDFVRLVALDGFNAALYDIPASLRVVPEQGCTTVAVVNHRSMEAVAELVSGDVQICLGEGFVVFKTDDVTVTGTMIEGAFPSYERHFADAEKGDKVWTVSKAEFARLLKAITPFAQASYSSPPFIQIELSDVRKAVTVDGYAVDLGDCMGTIRASGKGAIAFHVSPAYIKKAVGSIVGGELAFVLRGHHDGYLLKPLEGDRHKIMMMPMVIKPFEGRREEEADDTDQELAGP